MGAALLSVMGTHVMFKLFLPVSKRGMRWRKDSTIDKQIIEKQFLLT